MKLKQIFLRSIRIYQLCFSPWFGGQCRFYPSCSHYASQSLNQYGASKGVWLTIKRIFRCHPLAKGGIDLP